MVRELTSNNQLKSQINRKNTQLDHKLASITQKKKKLWRLRWSYFLGKLSLAPEINTLKQQIIKEQKQVEKLQKELAGLEKGGRGEYLVRELITEKFSDEFYLCSDFKINASDGKYQIDHLLISPWWIVLIETKNLSGTFFVTDGGWLRASFKGGDNQVKIPVDSPQEQIKRHYQKVNQLLLDNGINCPVYPIVVLVREKCRIYYQSNDWDFPVMFQDEMLEYINSLPRDEVIPQQNIIDMLK